MFADCESRRDRTYFFRAGSVLGVVHPFALLCCVLCAVLCCVVGDMDHSMRRQHLYETGAFRCSPPTFRRDTARFRLLGLLLGLGDP